MGKSCSVHLCQSQYYAKGHCRRHYRQAREGRHFASSPRSCVECGKGFPVTARPQQRFCNHACSMKWNRKHGCYTSKAISLKGLRCRIDGCSKDIHSGGLCRPHHMRLWRYGNAEHVHERWRERTCSVEGCGVTGRFASGLCSKHYFNSYYYKHHQREKARRNARRARVRQATPPWADMKAIETIYENCPPGYHVDHCIPLKGEIVSGLHCEANLAYLPAQDNRVKSNTYVISPGMASMTIN